MRRLGTTSHRALWSLTEKLGVDAVAERLVQHGWIILFGHGICASAFEMVEDDPRHIPVSVFRDQMKYLIARGYTFVTLTEGLSRLQSGEALGKIATLTFDDGFRNVIEFAYPVMVELDLRGCFYPVVDYVGSENLLWTDMIDVVCWYNKGCESLPIEFPDSTHCYSLVDEKAIYHSIKAIKRDFRSISESERIQLFKQMEQLFSKVPHTFIPRDFCLASWDELRSLNPAILEIGSHTISHPNLERVGRVDALRHELVQSKKILERELGHSISHFCYPAGSYNMGVMDEVESAGYRSAVTIKYGTNGHGVSSFELKRLALPSTLAQFKARISGVEGGLMRIRDLFSLKWV